MADNNIKLGSSRAKLNSKLQSYKRWKHTPQSDAPSVHSEGAPATNSSSKFRNLHDMVSEGATTTNKYDLVQKHGTSPLLRKKYPVLPTRDAAAASTQSTSLRQTVPSSKIKQPDNNRAVDDETAVKQQQPSVSLANKASRYKQKWKKHSSVATTNNNNNESQTDFAPVSNKQPKWKRPETAHPSNPPPHQQSLDEPATSNSTSQPPKVRQWRQPPTRTVADLVAGTEEASLENNVVPVSVPKWKRPSQNTLECLEDLKQTDRQTKVPPPPEEQEEPSPPLSEPDETTKAPPPNKISRSVVGYWHNRSAEPSPVKAVSPNKQLSPNAPARQTVHRNAPSLQAEKEEDKVVEQQQPPQEETHRSASKLKDLWNQRAAVASPSPAKKSWGTTKNSSAGVKKRWTVGPTDQIASSLPKTPPPFWKTNEMIMKRSGSLEKSTASPSNKSVSTKSSASASDDTTSNKRNTVVETPARRKVSDMASLFSKTPGREESSVVSAISSSRLSRREDDTTVVTEKSAAESTLESNQPRPRPFVKSPQPSWVKNHSIPEHVDISDKDSMDVNEEPAANERSIVSSMKTMFNGGQNAKKPPAMKLRHSLPSRNAPPSWVKSHTDEEATETTVDETEHDPLPKEKDPVQTRASLPARSFVKATTAASYSVRPSWAKPVQEEDPVADKEEPTSEETIKSRSPLPTRAIPTANSQTGQAPLKPAWAKSAKVEDSVVEKEEDESLLSEQVSDPDLILESIDSTYHDRDDSFEDIQALGTIQSSQSENQREPFRPSWAKPAPDEAVEDEADDSEIQKTLENDESGLESQSRSMDASNTFYSVQKDTTSQSIMNARLRVKPAVTESGKPSWVKEIADENEEATDNSASRAPANVPQSLPVNAFPRSLNVSTDADTSPEKIDPVEFSGIGERQGWESPRAARLKAQKNAKKTVADRFVDGLRESDTNKEPEDLDSGYVSTDTESKVSVSDMKARLWGTGTEEKLVVPKKHSLSEFRAKQTKQSPPRPLSSSPPPTQQGQQYNDWSPPRPSNWPPKHGSERSPPRTSTPQNTPATPPLRGLRGRTDVSTPSGMAPPVRDSLPEKNRDDLMCPELPPMDSGSDSDRGYSHGRSYKSNVGAALGDAMDSFARKKELEEKNDAFLPPRPLYNRSAAVDAPVNRRKSHFRTESDGDLQVDLSGKKVSPTKIESPPDEPVSMPTRGGGQYDSYYKTTIDSSSPSIGMRSWPPPRAPDTAHDDDIAAFEHDDSEFSEVIDMPPDEEFDEDKYTYSAEPVPTQTISPRSKAQYPWNKDANTLSPTTWQKRAASFDADQSPPEATEEERAKMSAKHEASPNLQQLAVDSNHAVDYDSAMAGAPQGNLFDDEEDDHSRHSNRLSPCLPDTVPPEFEKALSGEGQSGDELYSHDSKHFGDPSSYANLSVAERAKALASWNGGLGVPSPPVDKQEKYRQEIGQVSSKFKQWEEKKEDEPASSKQAAVPEGLDEDFNFDQPGIPFAADAWTPSNGSRKESQETRSLGYLFDDKNTNDQVPFADSKVSKDPSTMTTFDPFADFGAATEFSEKVEFTKATEFTTGSDFFGDAPTFGSLAPPSGSMEDGVWSYEAADIPSYDADTSSLNISDTAAEI